MAGTRWWLIICIASALVVLAGCRGESTSRADAEETTVTTRESFGVGHVRRVFARHGLPLIECEVASTLIRDPRTFESGRAGPVFRVEVYATVEKAASSEGLIFVLYPPGYQACGQISSAREANVRVVYESGRPRQKARLRAALRALG